MPTRVVTTATPPEESGFSNWLTSGRLGGEAASGLSQDACHRNSREDRGPGLI